MKFTKTQFLAIGLFLVLLVSLPVAVFLSQKRQDIRPRAVDTTYICPFDCQTWNPAGPNCAGAPSNGCGFGLDIRTCTAPYTGCVTLTPELSPTLTPTPTLPPKSAPATSTPTPPPIVGCIPLPHSDNFNSYNTAMWNFWNTPNIGVISPVGGNVQASVPGNGYSGLITDGNACGNFDVNVEFSQFTSGGQSEADVRLSVEEDVGNLTVVPSTLFIERYSKGNEQGFAAKMVRGGQEQTASPAASFATSGKLRIRRVGSVFTTYYDVGSGWQTLAVFASGFTSDVHPAIIVKSWDQNPSVSANFDNFNLTNAILDPSATLIPPSPTLTPIPTPPSGRDRYLIDVGDKQSLVLNIGPAIAPQLKFKAKLAGVRSYPDMYLRLRVKDELAFMDRQNDASASASSCNNAVAPDRDFYIPVKANTEGIYSPVQQITSPVPSGAQVAQVSADGWVMVDGVVPGRYYTLYLKGPKTRKSKMLEHFLLQPNQISTQDYDWTGKPLDPGDLPDPSEGQDCTINSKDWSLLQSRIGSTTTDAAALSVADVDYSGLVNAGDSVALLETLKLRPDDDN